VRELSLQRSVVKNAKCERISIVHQAGKRRQDARKGKIKQPTKAQKKQPDWKCPVAEPVVRILTFKVEETEVVSNAPTGSLEPIVHVPEIFFSTDGWTDTFFLTKVDAQRGRPAAPSTSRAHEHVMMQSFAPHLNGSCDLCDPCAFISHVWSSFHGCAASLQSSA
jgi:hypothetical protein